MDNWIITTTVSCSGLEARRRVCERFQRGPLPHRRATEDPLHPRAAAEAGHQRDPGVRELPRLRHHDLHRHPQLRHPQLRTGLQCQQQILMKISIIFLSIDNIY